MPQLSTVRSLFASPFTTAQLVGLSAGLTALAWAGTVAVGFALYARVGLASIVLLLSGGWLAGSLGAIRYLSQNTPSALTQRRVWRLWAWLSVAGCLINGGAGVVMSVQPSATAAVVASQYGVILPWTVVYAVGYLATGGLNWANTTALSRAERGLYLAFGVVSAGLAVALAWMPSLHGPVGWAMIPLSLAAVVTLWVR